MKKISIIMLISSFLISVNYSFGQCKLTSGDISGLKGQDEVNLQFDYSKMAVGKFKTEDEYIEKKKADMNKHKSGSGDDWAEKWKNDKTEKYQPEFERGMNIIMEKFNFKSRENATSAKYTLVVHTTFLEIGMSSTVGYGYAPFGAGRKETYITLVVDLIETANPGKVLATIDMKRENTEYAGVWDVDPSLRIQGAYTRAGEDLADFIYKTNRRK